MSGPPDPSVSDATFVQECVEAGKDLRSVGLAEISILWKGRPFSMVVAPDTVLSYTDRIEGKLREVGAKYLVWRDGNKCSIRSSFCIMGENAFADPARADFDHIDGNEMNHKAGNLRLACHPCNSHEQSAQTLQWKRRAAASTDRPREREKTGASNSILPTGYAPIDLNTDLYPRLVRWLDESLKLANGVPLEEAIYKSAREIHAELGHGAWQTMRGYLNVLTKGDGAPFYIEPGTKMVKRSSRQPK